MRALALCCAAALALAGCGGGSAKSEPTVDGDAVVRDLKPRLQLETKTIVDRVACPTDIEATLGKEFECNASFDGEADIVLLRLTDVSREHPRYTLRLKNLLLGKLERAINVQFTRQGVPVASVDCPGPQPQRRGHVFRCSVEDPKERRGAVVVRETDDRGHVSFRLL